MARCIDTSIRDLPAGSGRVQDRPVTFPLVSIPNGIETFGLQRRHHQDLIKILVAGDTTRAVRAMANHVRRGLKHELQALVAAQSASSDPMNAGGQ